MKIDVKMLPQSGAAQSGALTLTFSESHWRHFLSGSEASVLT